MLNVFVSLEFINRLFDPSPFGSEVSDSEGMRTMILDCEDDVSKARRICGNELSIAHH